MFILLIASKFEFVVSVVADQIPFDSIFVRPWSRFAAAWSNIPKIIDFDYKHLVRILWCHMQIIRLPF